MLYFALFPNRERNDRGIDLLARPNRLTELLADADAWTGAVRVVDFPAGALTLYADAERQRLTVTLAP
jgi:hypothetical protein